jgi:hypothetical protein
MNIKMKYFVRSKALPSITSLDSLLQASVEIKKQEEVEIVLSQTEAGFLRSIMMKLGSGAGDGFSYQLTSELAKLQLPEYDAKYPHWKDQQISIGSNPTIKEAWYGATKPEKKQSKYEAFYKEMTKNSTFTPPAFKKKMEWL